MKDVSTHVGILAIVSRLPQSAEGNPRFYIMIGGVPCTTTVDSALAYTVQSMQGKVVTAQIGTHYNTASLEDVALANTNEETQ
jgi:hypothetical protein